MIQQLLLLDSQIFIFLNHLPHNLFLDTLFGFITFVGYLGGIWIVISLLLYFKNKKKYEKLLKLIFLIDILSLIIGEWFLKNIIARPRPKIDLPGAIVPFDFYHSFSFPSGHAVMSFAAAFVLGRVHKKSKWLYYSLAMLISFSRIYLGKHYPSDVLVGAVIGLLIGYICHKFYLLTSKQK